MGPLFVILFWLVVAGVFGVFWIIALTLCIIGKPKHSRLMIWLGGIPLAILTAIAFGILGLTGYGIIRATNPRYIYQDAF
jgi:hypothetical protein